MVDNGKAGLLARPGESASLAEQTVKALTGDTSALVNALHERVETVYGAERNIEATWEVYREAMGASVAGEESRVAGGESRVQNRE
jgi:hypothetical protein